jgi:cytochrome c oxidase subunit II
MLDTLLLPDQASTTAAQVDALFLFLLTVTGGVAVLIAAIVLLFAFRYRHRRQNAVQTTPRIRGSAILEVLWTGLTLSIFVVMFLWGAAVYVFIVRPPSDSLEIYVVGKQWMWKIQHRTGQREINELHVPLGRPIKLILTSQDVIHSFFIPDFRIKVDVLPNRYVQSWFEPTKSGVYRLYCSEYCGTGHANMNGVVVVQTPTEYARWLRTGAEGSLALEGRKLFHKYQCIGCHSADAVARGPVLEGLFGRRVPMDDGSDVIADETYLRESILNPDAKVVAGFRSIMPAFEEQLDEEQLIALVEFIKSLEPGGTPDRISDESPPVIERGDRVPGATSIRKSSTEATPATPAAAQPEWRN